MMFQRLGLLLLAFVLTACALPRMPDLGGRAPAPSSPPSSPGSSSSRNPAPIADLPISINGQCAQQDESGFREQASLRINDSVVQQVAWQLWVGRRGSCEFKQADFRQTQRRPHVELTANDGSGCKLMIWRDDRRITLAHAGCQKRCSPGIYEEAWPVMFDPASGACAKDR
jgi:hypothetical protein